MQHVARVFFLEHELARVRDVIDVERAIKVIELVLEQRGEKALGDDALTLPVQVRECHLDVLGPFHEAA